MADVEGAKPAPKRRARRTTAATRTTRTPRATRSTRGTTTTRRRAAAGGHELVDNLNGMVDQLIKENRKLKRQLDKVVSKSSSAAGAGIERGLKSIQRRVQKALGGTTPTRRRSTRAAAGTGARRATTTRRRRTTKPETPSS